MLKSLTYIFGQVEIYDGYIVAIMNEGVHISPEYNKVLEDIVNRFYKNKPFVYLTHRKHSYSVDPAIYFETSKIENLAGFGVIAEIPVSGPNAAIEKLFINKPFEIFESKEQAIAWAKTVLNNEPQGS